MRIFKWIVCARRPLTIDELQEALAIDEGDKFLDTSKLPTDRLEMIQVCGNLVTYDRDDQTVRFVHHTVQQFFVKEASRQPSFDDVPNKPFVGWASFSLEEAQNLVGQVCLDYLYFSDFEQQITLSENQSLTTDSSTVSALVWTGVPNSLLRVLKPLLSSWTASTTVTLDGSLLPSKSARPSLHKKYRLLEYISTFWPWHIFSLNLPPWKIRDLVETKQFPFEMRPWNAESYALTKPPRALPKANLFRFASAEGLLPLLQLCVPHFTDYYDYEIKNNRNPAISACDLGHISIFEALATIEIQRILKMPKDSIDIMNRNLIKAAADSSTAALLPKLLKLYEELDVFLGMKLLDSLLVILEDATVAGKLQTVENILSQDIASDLRIRCSGASNAAATYDPISPPDLAATHGHIAILKLFISHGWNLGHSMVCAVRNHQEDALRTLLIRGQESDFYPYPKSDFKLQNHIAPVKRNSAIAQSPDHSAVFSSTYFGAMDFAFETVIDPSHQRGEPKTIELLLEHGADFYTPLFQAVRSENLYVVKNLLSVLGNDLVSGVEELLHYAVENSNSDVLGALLKHEGIDISSPNFNGLTPLHLAANLGRLEATECLLADPRIQVNIVTKNHDRRTALYLAARRNCPEIVQMLLGHQDIDVNAYNSDGETALHIAATLHEEHIDAAAFKRSVIRLLLKHPTIDVRATNRHGENVLHLAIVQGRQELFIYLLPYFQKDGKLTIETINGVNLLIHAAGLRSLTAFSALIYAYPRSDVDKLCSDIKELVQRIVQAGDAIDLKATSIYSMITTMLNEIIGHLGISATDTIIYQKIFALKVWLMDTNTSVRI